MNSEIKSHTVKDPKSKLTSQQSTFSNPTKQSSSLAITSFKISPVLAKIKKKKNHDEVVIKEIMASSAESL